MSYLSPEPLLETPNFVAYRAKEGLSPPAYAYASNNTLNRYDPDGLHDTNGCRNGGSCDTCAQRAGEIRDEALRKCVISQCFKQDVKLKCDPRSKEKAVCGPVPRGRQSASAPVGTSTSPAKKVNWCEDNLSDECQALLLVHELAHTCGWRDERNPPPGVPYDDLAKCMVQP